MGGGPVLKNAEVCGFSLPEELGLVFGQGRYSGAVEKADGKGGYGKVFEYQRTRL
jgi:hypothetical protein